MEILQIIFKTFCYYVLVATIFRLMGKREVGQLGTFDLVVFVLIAELVAMGIENKFSFVSHLLPVLLLVILQITISKISIKSVKFRNFVDGKPTLIIKNGIVNFKNMIDQRYTLDDLLLQLREKNIRSISEVEYAFLETNGKLSVFQYKDKSKIYPMPIIVDGVIDYSTLIEIKRSKEWIMSFLKKKKINLDNVFYAFCKSDELYIIEKDNYKK